MKHRISAAQFIERLEDPDNIGSAEYRCIYDLLIEHNDDDPLTPEIIDTILSEFIEWSKKLKATLNS